MRLSVDKLEDQYYEWLEITCKCDIEEEGCCCLDFDNWLEEKREDAVLGIA